MYICMWWAGWRAKTTKTGEVYYVNDIDKTTSWDRPTASMASSSPGGADTMDGTFAWVHLLHYEGANER